MSRGSLGRFWRGTLAAATAAGVAGCTAAYAPVETAPVAATHVPHEDAVIADIVSRLSVERKVAQLIQPQINSFTVADMERYRFGSYLNGGNGGPYGDEFAPALEWLRLADEMYDASVKPLPAGEPVIPVLWGTDAVHGHTNVVGATIFPHNIGLGATRDADLVRRIGQATAIEIEVTGIDWNFSPTVAIARDDRWGRTYESYSEDPQLVARLGAALVEGLQGRPGDPDYLREGRVIATAKHFFGDGGTVNGVDQGEVTGDIEALKALHAVPYPVAIEAGVQSIMASFNSINGKKMHGNKALLTDYLRGELGFDGLVVGDWNGHQQVAGCSVTDCPQSLLAGLDIYMVPDDWKGLLETLVAQVEDGTIPMARLDEAVGRVLRMKHRAGLLGTDAVRPSARPNAGDLSKLGSAEHRAIAREAVAKSQVILKNEGILPLQPGAKVLVAGSGADDIARASGGWTLTWQGGGELDNSYFPGATSIWSGIKAAADAGGGSATYTPDGSYETKPDVAVVVFGEKPHAEYAGDQRDLVMRDEGGLSLLRKYQADGIATVAVFLSGRPMWMNRELNASDAFVASWLPGSEGAGVADVLFGAHPASGTLSFSWPATCEGAPLNTSEGALFPVGYGLVAGATGSPGMLGETCTALDVGAARALFEQGRVSDGALFVALRLPGVPGDALPLQQFRGSPPQTGITVRGIDKDAQEDAREITFAPSAAFAFGSSGGDSRGFRIVYLVPSRPTAPIELVASRMGADATGIDITQEMAHAAQKGWREMVVTPQCLGDLADKNLTLRSDGAFTLQIAGIQREDFPEGTACSF